MEYLVSSVRADVLHWFNERFWVSLSQIWFESKLEGFVYDGAIFLGKNCRRLTWSWANKNESYSSQQYTIVSFVTTISTPVCISTIFTIVLPSSICFGCVHVCIIPITSQIQSSNRIQQSSYLPTLPKCVCFDCCYIWPPSESFLLSRTCSGTTREWIMVLNSKADSLS